ncbi:hypothetical protein [Glycomyces dulcitolivorans]|uniref:hypothetical protein n=1 Tax=Glycomyces dulcitolivorans TaxID=2200759 RepID=UPI0018E516B4|nr:hypothetical protein [Glycomyces dulcitolivorans]
MAPTFDRTEKFKRDQAKLDADQRARLRKSVKDFVEDLKEGRQPRPGLRVKGLQGHDGIYELTWAPDGRATWAYGEEVVEGEVHVVWRRVGTHDIFKNP